MTREDLDAYIAGRLQVPGQRVLTRAEAERSLANLRMSFGLSPERRGGVELGLEEDVSVETKNAAPGGSW
jgi:hypothetical protein